MSEYWTQSDADAVLQLLRQTKDAGALQLLMAQTIHECNVADASFAHAMGWPQINVANHLKFDFPVRDSDTACREKEKCWMKSLMVERFVLWHETIQELARYHGESLASLEELNEEYFAGRSASDAFYAKYPAHRNQ